MTGLSTALQELLYGFIMCLIYIDAAKFGLMEFTDREGFIGIILGMIVTWGVIDAIVYYYLTKCNQRLYIRVISGADSNLSREERIDILMNELSGTPLDVIKNEEQRRICENLLDREIEPEEEIKSDTHGMMLTAIGMIIFTMITLIPILVPVMIFDDLNLGMDIASYMSSICLFFVGFHLGPKIGVNSFLSGLTLSLVTLAISLIATLTGG